jgi:hypothetical protein
MVMLSYFPDKGRFEVVPYDRLLRQDAGLPMVYGHFMECLALSFSGAHTDFLCQSNLDISSDSGTPK